jgi:hypothetical protein
MMNEPRAPESIDEIVFRDLLADGIPVSRFPILPPAEFERILRDSYQPIVSPEDYARLREKCGLGSVIDGEIVEPRLAIEAAPDA